MEIEADDTCWNLFNTFKDDTHTNTEPPQQMCHYCSSTDVILDDGNYVCTSCGTLYDRMIDANAEWRYYGHEDSKSWSPHDSACQQQATNICISTFTKTLQPTTAASFIHATSYTYSLKNCYPEHALTNQHIQACNSHIMVRTGFSMSTTSHQHYH